MAAKTTATLLAWLSFATIVGLGLLGADRPPPPGFLLVVAMAAGFGIGVRLSIPLLLQRSAGTSLSLSGLYGAGLCLSGWALSVLGRPWSAWSLVGLIVVVWLGAIGGVLVMGAALLLARTPS